MPAYFKLTMELKASLHIHTSEDQIESHVIKYNIYQLINRANQLGFKVLALTCHKKFVFKPEYVEYASSKGILLISGVELFMSDWEFWRSDVLVLNCDKTIEQVKNFKQLAVYKKKHPEIFIIAPHPNYGRRQSLGIKKLVKYINLFDAIEHCWFYSKRLNFNTKVKAVAKNFSKPFIATADVHSLNYFNNDYSIIKVRQLSTENIFKAIKGGDFINITSPKKLSRLFIYMAIFRIKRIIFLPLKLWQKGKKYVQS